ncbi:LacI family DNA-binding transcriptional regulator [Pseudokineococcus basanitobsidens]|uniref:LacI family DNA-binding transcriptional regulator n=1 Tax=Pseudokineococcus basanitobsidens TaxID=1926649 RepID=A0ABU8RGT0_9ACTN
MPHTYRVREIAAQAGLSPATVDRVLHARGGVRASTVREVEQAVADLDRQQAQLRIGTRTSMVDVVVQAPARFSGGVRAAMEAELPTLRPAVVRARFHLHEGGSPGDVVAALGRVGRGRTDGVVLKAPDVPEVVDAVAALDARGVPVVTLATDLPTSARVAYVGADNRAAGATAAYLVHQWAGRPHGSGRADPTVVLVVRGRSSSRGEDEREMGFRATLRELAPAARALEVVDDEEDAGAVRRAVDAALAERPDVGAVYSLYAGAGGNGAVLAALDAAGRRCPVVAHDLDGENVDLLRRHRLSAVLHHDLRQDVRRACHALLRADGHLPGPVRSGTSAVTVVTPYNLPRSVLATP